jgi:hypothetical protein
MRKHEALGRRTKLSFLSANRSGYLNLDTNQSYTYDSSKHRLTLIQRESTSEKAEYVYDDTDGAMTKVSHGNGASVEYGLDGAEALGDAGIFCLQRDGRWR